MNPPILIIEDEMRLARLLSMELSHEGYETEVVLDGKNGLERIKERKFGAVLLDYMLPIMDGLEVCKKTREFSDIPIIVLTVRDDVSEEILQAGATACLTKPCLIDDILKILYEKI